MIKPLIPDHPKEPCFYDTPPMPKKYMNENMYLMVAPMVLATGEMAVGIVQKNGECRHFTVIIKSGNRMLAEATCFDNADKASHRANEILEAIKLMMKSRLGYSPVDTMAN